MKKSYIILVSTIVLLASGTVLYAQNQKLFTDVTTNDWFYEDVQKLTNMGVVKGYDDGLFKPDNNVNRAEVSVMFNRYDQKKIQGLLEELTILRSERTENLNDISDWKTFRNEAGNLPYNKYILPSYSKRSVDWTALEKGDLSNLEIVATDNSGSRVGGVISEIVVPENLIDDNPNNMFLVRMHFSSGTFVYGPFFGQLEALVTDVQNNYFDDNKSVDLNSLKF